MFADRLKKEPLKIKLKLGEHDETKDDAGEPDKGMSSTAKALEDAQATTAKEHGKDGHGYKALAAMKSNDGEAFEEAIRSIVDNKTDADK